MAKHLLKESRVVKELIDADVLAEALAAACLDHKVPSEVRRWGGLEGVEVDATVQGVSGHTSRLKMEPKWSQNGTNNDTETIK